MGFGESIYIHPELEIRNYRFGSGKGTGVASEGAESEYKGVKGIQGEHREAHYTVQTRNTYEPRSRRKERRNSREMLQPLSGNLLTIFLRIAASPTAHIPSIAAVQATLILHFPRMVTWISSPMLKHDGSQSCAGCLKPGVTGYSAMH